MHLVCSKNMQQFLKIIPLNNRAMWTKSQLQTILFKTRDTTDKSWIDSKIKVKIN